MTRPEAVLLRSWLLTNPIGVEELWFDVAMDGIPAQLATINSEPHQAGPEYERMWQRLNSKRADVIARYGAQYKIIELRPDARAQTIGELHQYRYLAAAEWPGLQWLRPLLITAQIDPLVKATIMASDIDIVEIPGVVLSE